MTTDEAGVALVFNATSQDDFDFVAAEHRNSKAEVYGAAIEDGLTSDAPSRSTSTSNQPSLSSSDVLWVRVVCTGGAIEMYQQEGATQPAPGSWGSHCYRSTGFDNSGGMIGFVTWTMSGAGEVDDFVLRSDRDGNGSYETLEHEESFTATPGSIGGSVEIEEALTHDAAGNLTYDGVYAYGYDAWNRLVKVTKAWRTGNVPAGSLNEGSVVQESEYDGLGRRIVKAVQNSAELDATYHYYYSGQSIVEVRNGSDATLKQYVWGGASGGYIDELVQTSINDDPADGTEQVCESSYWALQDANFNVLGVIDDDGDLVERYEYTPYGERVVFFEI